MSKKPARKNTDAKSAAKAKEKAPAKAAKPAPKAKSAKEAGKAQAPATESTRRPGRPRKDGTADYAVQARKMKALLDVLVTAEELTEGRILELMSELGFDLHPRTLAREVERLAIVGFPVVRIHGPEGILYSMPEDDTIGRAIDELEAVRKALKKEGSAQEKAVQSVLKLLKD
jgi:hypothetical protein